MNRVLHSDSSSRIVLIRDPAGATRTPAVSHWCIATRFTWDSGRKTPGTVTVGTCTPREISQEVNDAKAR